MSFHEEFIRASKERHRRLSLLDDEITTPEIKCDETDEQGRGSRAASGDDGAAGVLGSASAARISGRGGRLVLPDWRRVRDAAEHFDELVLSGTRRDARMRSRSDSGSTNNPASRRSSFNDDNLVAFFGHDEELRDELKKTRLERRSSLVPLPPPASEMSDLSTSVDKEERRLRSKSFLENAQAQTRINLLRRYQETARSPTTAIAPSRRKQGGRNIDHGDSGLPDARRVIAQLEHDLLAAKATAEQAESTLHTERQNHKHVLSIAKQEMQRNLQDAKREILNLRTRRQGHVGGDDDDDASSTITLADHESRVASIIAKFKQTSLKTKAAHDHDMQGAHDQLRLASTERARALERVRVEQEEITDAKLRAQHKDHADAVETAVSIAVRTATSALREKYEKDLKEVLAGDEKHAEQFSRLREEYQQLRSEHSLLSQKMRTEADIASERIAALERSLNASLSRNESLSQSLGEEETRVRKLVLERSDAEALMAKERAERAAELQQQGTHLRESLETAKAHAEKEADWEIQKKRASFALSQVEDERDAALARANNLAQQVEQLVKERDADHKRVLLHQDQAYRAKRLAEEHHRSKAANVRKALSEERARARSLKGSQADSARKLAKAETELAVLRKQVKNVSEEARAARAAAKASFEATEHREHGVLGHALQAKQATVEVLQDQLLQQQQAHMKFAKDAAQQQRKLHASHAETCKRMERDYSKALKAAQSGAARQIENLSSQLGEDARDAQERRFMVSKRHQDHIERIEQSHRREVQDLHVQLEAERDRNRSLQAKASILAADLEEAATAGMLHIVESLGSSDNGSRNYKSRGSLIRRGFESHANVPTPAFSPSYTSVFPLPLDQKHDDDGVGEVDDRAMGRVESGDIGGDNSLIELVSPSPQSLPGSGSLRNRARGSASAFQTQRLVSLSTPSPSNTLSGSLHREMLSSKSSMTSMSALSSTQSTSSSSSSISAALYRAQLEHVAVRSKTEERLLHARKRMAAARAKEADLELRAVQLGLS